VAHINSFIYGSSVTVIFLYGTPIFNSYCWGQIPSLSAIFW
jgi:hypothetical protein